ncbi:hypothetical protein CHLRE_15g641350v5 [Chlamydomonas reinhardtii]|uniref:Uncharacterized protein n=1 Tax=Chlamydomonas reinhardtii TaxID=3055 RepID=A0A2K3CWV7_CHLRE|nr:uncharacterized protein CHLRE_15g641350v5 [Chlamydomonas reinhardtii]PNW72761.1 hypothetical protein CHLRE_15g641350v5 [Chlamydomonas reinhardtii]
MRELMKGQRRFICVHQAVPAAIRGEQWMGRVLLLTMNSSSPKAQSPSPRSGRAGRQL